MTGLVRADKDVDGLTPMSAGLLTPRPPRPAARARPPASWCCSRRPAPSSRAPRRSSSAARTSSASRWPSCCSPANATVTVCHSRTRDLPEVCRRADVLIAAVGRDRMVKADWVKPGATVIDVGMNRSDDGLNGDVDFDAVAGGRGRDHAGARRRRPDDDRAAAGATRCAPRSCRRRVRSSREAQPGAHGRVARARRRDRAARPALRSTGSSSARPTRASARTRAAGARSAGRSRCCCSPRSATALAMVFATATQRAAALADRPHRRSRSSSACSRRWRSPCG